MKHNHSFWMPYKQRATSILVCENKLQFVCRECGFEKEISAKFLKREARLGRAYLIDWVLDD